MECQCDHDTSEDAVPGWWLSGSNVQMGAFTVVGYLLYRFSQTLPALIRWPIRIFCSLTGLSALWGWVSRLIGTIRGIQTLFKWLSRIWRFFEGSSSEGALESSVLEEGFRVILLGPAGAGRTSLAETLLGASVPAEQKGPLMESTRQRKVTNGAEITVIETPDLLGTSLGTIKRAVEALRSVQLAGPGPHAFLLVTPGSGRGLHRDVAQWLQTAAELFGDEAADYIIPVFTHADRLPHPEPDSASLRGQRPELVDAGADRGATRGRLLGRLAETSELRGHFVHSLQRKEERMRAELLDDAASELAEKLGQN